MSATPDVALDARIATLRERLVALGEARARGELDADAYEAARRDADRALSDAVLAMPASMPVPAPARAAASTARPGAKLIAIVSTIVVVIAIGGYAFTGSPSLATRTAAAPVAPAAAADGDDREASLKQIAEMVDKLAARLAQRPDDAEGWTMLARSYAVLGRYADAIPAYRRAVALNPKDAGLLADDADAIAAANGGRQDEASLALIDRALAIDPKQPKALALSGTVAFDRGDFAKAAAQWQRIADQLPPDSDFHRQVMANIDEARRRGGLAAATPIAPIAAARPSTAPSTATASSTGAEAVSGVVRLAPALASRAAPDDTVFVIARPVSGRMPVAAMRAKVSDLPLAFRLDDRMAMAPTMKLSDMKDVVVVARVSKSGNAMSQPGDLAGESAPIAPGTHDLSIVIGDVVGAK